MSDYAQALQSLRPQLLKYARLQLRNPAWAEDAVSETLLAALEKPQAFAGQSQLKTWLIGILKHKLIDQIRRNSREISSSASDDDGVDLDELLFKPDGHWREVPQDWGDPEQALRQLEFMKVLEACVDHLPGQQGRLFMMREWLELDTEEICKVLAISPTNLWVMLHRARLRLRECLQLNWFSGAPAPIGSSTP
ncbi:sigma-70 family RNA polymerase sigma factor [Roseateles sp.]|jgi:RNA polymerase sigma-70 factor (TIGR02943 family)|uniref:sigma-70 family RNA polymerase sigma factor n=1 Tax=Roseateles sp. TaxID=1971397 RepID=UPI0037C5E87C